MTKRTLVLGDLHGHFDRFELLLMQEGLIDRCERCDGAGEIDPQLVECPDCHGDGWERIRRDEVEVVLVGDIGHWGRGGSPTGDLMTLRAAIHWADVILWGNHDRAVVDPVHCFSGYITPDRETHILFDKADWKLAHAAHGFLITHAGLHHQFKFQPNVSAAIKEDPQVFADWINEISHPDSEGSVDQFAVRDAVSARRGGGSSAGGILWRDIEEKLYSGFPQVFGHSADHAKHAVRYCTQSANTRSFVSIPEGIDVISYCVDVGGKGDRPGDNCLAGIYLPDKTIVRIDLD